MSHICICVVFLTVLSTFTNGYIYRTGGSTGKGILSYQETQRDYSFSAPGAFARGNPATGILGAYNFDGQTYTSDPTMTIRSPYRAADSSHRARNTHRGAGFDWIRRIPGYRRNQHLWAGEHQKNYRVPVVGSDGWTRRYWQDSDALRSGFPKSSTGGGIVHRAPAQTQNRRIIPDEDIHATQPIHHHTPVETPINTPATHNADPISDRRIEAAQQVPVGQEHHHQHQAVPVTHHQSHHTGNVHHTHESQQWSNHGQQTNYRSDLNPLGGGLGQFKS